MNRTLYSVFFFVLTFSFIGGTGAYGSEEAVIHVGLSSHTIPKVRHNDAAAAIKVYAETIIQEEKIEESVDVRIIDSVEVLRNELVHNRLDAVAVTPLEFLELDIRPESIIIPATDAGFLVRYVLVVHRSSGFTSLEDLKNRRIAIAEARDMALATVWLESLPADHGDNNNGNWFRTTTLEENPSKVIFQTFFRQADAALTTREALDLAGELNPQLRKDLVVLFESPPLVAMFFFLRPSWQGKARDSFERAFLNLHGSLAGQQVLTAFQIANMSEYPVSVLDETLVFLRKHLQTLKSFPNEGDAR